MWGDGAMFYVGISPARLRFTRKRQYQLLTHHPGAATPNPFAVGPFYHHRGGEGGRGQHVKKKKCPRGGSVCLQHTKSTVSQGFSPCSTTNSTTKSSPRASRVRNPSTTVQVSRPQMGWLQTTSLDKNTENKQSYGNLTRQKKKKKKHAAAAAAADVNPQKRRDHRKTHSNTTKGAKDPSPRGRTALTPARPLPHMKGVTAWKEERCTSSAPLPIGRPW